MMDHAAVYKGQDSLWERLSLAVPVRSISKKSWKRILLWTPVAAISYVFILIIAYIFINPPLSTMIASQAIGGQPLSQKWVPIDKISPHLISAIIAAEDGRYCVHWGVDWQAMQKAWGDKDGKPRGASTIPMQTVKNLFLWNDRSYVRKVLEVPLAYSVSAFWSKRRLMEIYLNIAEWGPGIYGAEAASQFHFKKRAAYLSRYEASLLAASLPNPIKRRAGRPNHTTLRFSGIIGRRMHGVESWTSCVRR